MTVKLAKFFNGNTNATPPPLPPPNPIMMNATFQHKQNNQQHHLQQQKQYLTPPTTLPHYSPFYDVNNICDVDDDDDNMSMYSTTASIMTTRDHPYNNSQRPLLPARKPTTQLLHKKKLNATNNANANAKVKATAGTAKTTAPFQQQQQNHHHHQQQPQKTAATTATTMQPMLYQNQQQKSYISPYVQQQKRDSAKGLHGFNDFDILSQQYNQHLQSPHIGYPYGSPPSPTAVAHNATDFVFDTTMLTTTITTKPTPSPLLIQPRYANINNFASTTYNAYNKVINTIDYYGCAGTNQSSTSTPSSREQQFMGKSSRFEDDFCCRRNDVFQRRQQLDATSSGGSTSSSSGLNSNSSGGSNGVGGPFIFGLPPEQQTNLINHSSGTNGQRGFCNSSDTVISSERDYERDNYSTTMTFSGKSTMQQSTSDTSSSSQDSGPGDVSGNSCKKGAKFLLLRKSKSKKKTKKDKQSTTATATADLTKPSAATTTATKTPQKPTIKCVLVGDGAVGKTNLILSYLENRFNTEHVPTASDIYNADVTVNDSPVNLTICDTAGQDTLDPLRELCYPDSDVFLLCFSVAKPETFDAIKMKWAPKFAKSKAALILVGTQADLRTNTNVLSKLQTNGEKPISYADAWDLATTIGAKYIETSSVTQEKVKEVFDTAIWEGLRPSTLPPTPPPFWRKLFCLA